ncbi:MAG: thiosulfate oxidation carrier protein SoxY, partial [Gammaproteobacteria bacterium]
MNALRRNVLKGAAGAGAVAVAVAAGLLKPTQAMAAWNKSAFEAKNVGDVMKNLGVSSPADSKDISIKAPDIAENGAVVPVEVTSSIASTSGITILAEKNNAPLVADFGFQGGAQGFISTRIKMGTTSNVRVVVKAGGKLY